MPPTPVDDHTEEFEQLAGLVALDVLEGDELARFEVHAAHCEQCQMMLRLDRETLARLAPEMEPSADFKQRLMHRAAAELAGSQIAARDPTPLRPAPNVIPIWRRSRWVSAVAAVVVVALVSVGAFSYENQVVASYALTGSVPGTAVVTVRRSGAAELDMNGIQNPGPGSIYEAWIIPQGGQPVPAGVSASGTATLPLSGLAPGSTVAITQERARVDSPTSTPILAAVIQS
jgi:anti-sigma-K factor RskA